MPTTPSGPETCRQFLAAFLAKYPDGHLQAKSERVLKALEARSLSLRGHPGGWAAGPAETPRHSQEAYVTVGAFNLPLNTPRVPRRREGQRDPAGPTPAKASSSSRDARS